MSIHCQCIHCHVKLNLPAKLAGSKARCPKCKKIFLIPKESTESASGPYGSIKSPKEATDGSPASTPVAQTDANSNAPIAEAIPVDGIVDSIPMATPVETTVQSEDAGSGPTNSDEYSANAGELPQATVAISAPATSTLRRRPRGWQAVMGFVLGAFALLGCLAILAGIAYWLTTRGPQNGKVVIDIPVEHRSSCALFVDGEDFEIDRLGPVQVTLIKGSHQIEIRRLGFQPIRLQVLVNPRQEIPVQPEWIPLPDEDLSDDPFAEPSQTESRPKLDPVEAALGADVE